MSGHLFIKVSFQCIVIHRNKYELQWDTECITLSPSERYGTPPVFRTSDVRNKSDSEEHSKGRQAGKPAPSQQQRDTASRRRGGGCKSLSLKLRGEEQQQTTTDTI
jgi:hypothetical protein